MGGGRRPLGRRRRSMGGCRCRGTRIDRTRIDVPRLDGPGVGGPIATGEAVQALNGVLPVATSAGRLGGSLLLAMGQPFANELLE